MTTTRTANVWWMWHDRDQDRWSTSTEEAEARCAAWVAGQSDDGPSPGETITDEQIEALSTAAGAAGDLEQVAICERALDGDTAARVICERVIAAARAMED